MTILLIRGLKLLLLICILSFVSFFGIVLYAVTAGALLKITPLAPYLGIIIAALVSLWLLYFIIRCYRNMAAQ